MIFKTKHLETWKAHGRRYEAGFFDKYCQGLGLDVGCSADPLSPDDYDSPTNQRPLGSESDLPTWRERQRDKTKKLVIWDKDFGHGDAHDLAGIPNETFDYVHASHLLEHLEDPIRFLRRAFEVLKPGGYLLLLVPHRDRYENKRLLPSRWNEDHKSFWLPEEHDPPHTWGLRQVLLQAFDGMPLGAPEPHIQYIKVCDEGWTKPPEGQHAGGEYSIEAVIKKL